MILMKTFGKLNHKSSLRLKSKIQEAGIAIAKSPCRAESIQKWLPLVNLWMLAFVSD